MDLSKIVSRKHTTAPSKIRLIHRGNPWESPTDRAGHRSGLYRFGKYCELCWSRREEAEDVRSLFYLVHHHFKPLKLSLRGLQGHSDHFLDQSCSLLNSTDDILLVEDKEKDIKEWSWILRSARTLISRSSKFFGRYAKIGVLGSWKVVPKKILLIPSLPCAPPRFMPV